MRWQVQGTDADTGQYVELKLEQPEAAQAIQLAMQRRIVVERIDRAKRPMARMLGMIAMVAAILAGTGCGLFWMQNTQMQGELNQAIAEQTRLAVSVAQAENVAAELRDHGNLAQPDAAQVRKLAEDLTQARSKMSLTEQQLIAAQKHSDDLEAAAGKLPEVQKQVADLQGQLAATQGKFKDGEQQTTDLRAEITLQKKRMDQDAELSAQTPSPVRITALEQANKELTVQNEKITQELLEATARLSAMGDPDPAQDAAPVSTAPATGRWALRTTYDAANAFLVMRVNRDTLSTQPAAEGGGGMMATTGAIPENAARLRIVHDRGRERVYEAAAFGVFRGRCAAQKLAENAKLAAGFLSAFAPALKAPDDLVGAVTGQLGGRDGSQRLMFLTDDCRVTVWNDGNGVFTFRVDSSHREVE